MVPLEIQILSLIRALEDQAELVGLLVALVAHLLLAETMAATVEHTAGAEEPRGISRMESIFMSRTMAPEAPALSVSSGALAVAIRRTPQTSN